MTVPANNGYGTIIICAADELLATVADLKPAAVLSIEHPGVTEEQAGYAPRLTDGTPQQILTFWDTEDAQIGGGPDSKQAQREIEQGIDFVLPYLKAGQDVIIHCKAGKARSTGFALGVLAQLYPLATEEALVQKLLDIRAIAAPNIIVVHQADALAYREGRLTRAVERHPEITARRNAANASRRKWCAENPEQYPGAAPKFDIEKFIATLSTAKTPAEVDVAFAQIEDLSPRAKAVVAKVLEKKLREDFEGDIKYFVRANGLAKAKQLYAQEMAQPTTTPAELERVYATHARIVFHVSELKQGKLSGMLAAFNAAAQALTTEERTGPQSVLKPMFAAMEAVNKNPLRRVRGALGRALRR